MVAGHRFGVSGQAEDFALMGNYEPFACSDGETVFDLETAGGDAPAYTEEMRQDDEGQTIVCGRTAAGEAVFEFHWWGTTAGWLVCPADYTKGRLITTGRYVKMAIDNALMIMFALATADRQTVLFHAEEHARQSVAAVYCGHPTGERRQPRGAHRRGRLGNGLWLAVERQDAVLSQCALSAGCHRPAESGSLQQDTADGRHPCIRGTDGEHQRQAVGRAHCRRAASHGERAGIDRRRVASGMFARRRSSETVLRTSKGKSEK